MQAFGLETARKLLGGSLYHNCQTGVNQFKKAGRWSNTPEPGAVVFFTNGQRAYHTGIVTKIQLTRLKLWRATPPGHLVSLKMVVECVENLTLKITVRFWGMACQTGLW